MRNYVRTPEEKGRINGIQFCFCISLYDRTLAIGILLLHSTSVRKNMWQRESHTSYKNVENASLPVNCSGIYSKDKHIEEAITLSMS